MILTKDLVLYNEICQFLEGLHNWVNQCFQNDQYDFTKPWLGGRLFQRFISKDTSPWLKIKDRLMDFNVKGYQKFTDVISDSTLQLTSKKVPLVKFWYGIKEEYSQFSEKAVKILLPFLITYQSKARFLHLLQILQQIKGRRRYENSMVFY